ncbi:NUMOD4 domain-containing protein [uncultured Lactobacillus sp.]|jgi:hypothetical protein|uniref:NUMOD4 domain-containing protein n=1 Tax=uncultured Lactobacillus sp. TaxID=153152 RepID=UPI0028062FEA|nr:NUMOD4 domain-containing protein [uncultured Lactobacillus sp.]
MKEEWRDIEGYKGKYQVSSYGRVKSLAKKSWNGHAWWDKPEIILKPGTQKTGYLFGGRVKYHGKYYHVLEVNHLQNTYTLELEHTSKRITEVKASEVE